MGAAARKTQSAAQQSPSREPAHRQRHQRSQSHCDGNVRFRSNEQFYHDINLDTQFLEHNSTEEVVSYLYVTEAYYLNPKQVKRTQLLRLVGLIQNNIAANKPQNTRRKNFLERKRFINYEDNKQR